MDQIVRAWRVEMDVWESFDYASLAVVTGQPPPPAPPFPTAALSRAKAEADQALRNYRNSKERYEVRREQIAQEFYVQFVDLLGDEEASRVPPEPSTSLDGTLERAEDISLRYDALIQEIVNR